MENNFTTITDEWVPLGLVETLNECKRIVEDIENKGWMYDDK